MDVNELVGKVMNDIDMRLLPLKDAEYLQALKQLADYVELLKRSKERQRAA